MLNWYDDEELAIFFDHKPNTHMLDVLPSMTQAEKDMIELYPFINCTALRVSIYDKKLPKMYNFTIPKLFRYDGATIHRLLWWIIGSKTNPKFRIPALIHDYMCNNKYCVDFRRNFSSRVFRAMLEVAGVKKWRKNIMYFAVDVWQRFQKDWRKEK